MMFKKLKEKFWNYYTAQLILVGSIVATLVYGQYKIYTMLHEICNVLGGAFNVCGVPL